MARRKAVLILDPRRRREQRAYLAERVPILQESGDQLWAAVTDRQAARFTTRGIRVQIRDHADLIELPAIVFDPLEGEPTPPEDLAAPSPDGAALHLVQYVAPPLPAWLEAIKRSGGEYVQAVPVHAAAFRMSAEVAAAAAASPAVRWVGRFHPAYALHYSLAGRDAAFTPRSLPDLAVSLEGLPAGTGGNVQVQALEGTDPEAFREAVEAAGADVRGVTDDGLVLGVDEATLRAVLRLAATFAVEPHVPAQPAVAHGRVIAGLDQAGGVGGLPSPREVDGAGETVGVIDTGLDTGDIDDLHADLGDRVLEVRHRTSPGDPVPDPYLDEDDEEDDDEPSPHGTHVTGIVAGDGSGSHGADERVVGVAPASHIVFQGPLAGPTIRAFLVAHRAGARVHNNSWGVPGWDREKEERFSWANEYTGSAHAIDRFCATSPDDFVVFAAGNDEQDISGGPLGGANGTLDQNTLGQQAAAKNAFVVGATENLREGAGWPHSYRSAWSGHWEHSEWDERAGGPAGAYSISDDADHDVLFSNRGSVTGPVDTGRVRPDLAAPGTNILSLRPRGWATPDGQPWRDPDHHADLYYFTSGTSMAAPVVAGAAALVRQYLRCHHGQLRRPAMLEATPPWADDRGFVDRPAICPHPDGIAVAWVPPTGSEEHTRIVAVRLSAEALNHVDEQPRSLVDDVGMAAAPMLGRHGDAVLLVHRHRDEGVQLRRFRRDLTPDPEFADAGVRTVTDAASSESARPPTLVVAGNHVAVAWTEDDDAALRLRRFDAGSGEPVDDEPVVLGEAAHTSGQPYLVHTGDRYAAVWVAGAESSRLVLRLVEEDGEPVGDEPVVLAEEDAVVRDPHLLWDERGHGFVVVWCREHEGDTQLLMGVLDAAGELFTEPRPILPVPSGAAARRPQLAARPPGGYVLLWEDAARRGRLEACLTFLDTLGQPVLDFPRDPTDPLGRRLLGLSEGADDAEQATGFAAVVDADGAATVATQSRDGPDSGRRRVEVLGVTAEGAFRQPADHRAPLVRSGRFVPHTLGSEEPRPSPFGATAAAWAGGVWFHLRDGADPGILSLVRTTAEGLADATFGDDGNLTFWAGLQASGHAVRWTPSRLVVATIGGLGHEVMVFAFDQDGEPLPDIGGRHLPGRAHPSVAPQVGHFPDVPADDPDARPTFAVVYGAQSGIRYTRLDQDLGEALPPLELVTAPEDTELGTARHGWFQVVAAQERSIAAWHEHGPERTRVLVNRFLLDGQPQHPSPVVLTDAEGDARHAVVAVRPVGVTAGTSTDREYAIAWEHHPPGDGPTEIRFSRLDEHAHVMVDHNDVRVIHPEAPGWPDDTDACEPQLLCTFAWEQVTDEAGPGAEGATPGPWEEWSPGFGLAWIGRARDGGPRRLHFTALDENGRRLTLPLPPPHGPAGSHDPAPVRTLSDPTGDVREFQLLWNGRTFRLVWSEDHDGTVRHRQAALTRHGSPVVHDQPSAALVRAMLVNGATNLERTSLPNAVNGYGWGRLNVRQALAPAPPATLHVRDGDAVGPGRVVRYRFDLPPRTRLLRVTLAWTDPAGAELWRILHLRVVPPGGAERAEEYHGNDWELDDCKQQHLSRVIDSPAEPHQDVHNTEQVVLVDPVPGTYEVEVLGDDIPLRPEAQLPAAAFALVFAGSGPEKRFTAPPEIGDGLPVIGRPDVVAYPLTSLPTVEDPEDDIDYSAPMDPDGEGDLPEVPLVEVGERLDERLAPHVWVRQLAAPRPDDRDEKARYARIDPRLVDALQRIRDRVHVPVMVSSGYRYPALNARLGGSEYGQHVQGRAADIWALSAEVDALALAEAALRALGPDIGLAFAGDLIHVDVRGHRKNWTWGRVEMTDADFAAWVDDRWAEIRAERGELVAYPMATLTVADDPDDDLDYSDPVDPGDLDPVPLVGVENVLDACLSRGFRVRELAAPRLDDHGQRAQYARIDPRLVEALQRLRDRLGAPVIVESAYRYPALNDAVGGASDSQHLAGRAADIRCPRISPVDLARVTLDAVGCEIGLGLMATAIHLDVRGRRATWAGPGAEMDSDQFRDWVSRQCDA